MKKKRNDKGSDKEMVTLRCTRGRLRRLVAALVIFDAIENSIIRFGIEIEEPGRTAGRRRHPARKDEKNV